ncbi:MAG: hypothetical protein AB7S26_16475 [Sandaracinaceae bacterium]
MKRAVAIACGLALLAGCDGDADRDAGPIGGRDAGSRDAAVRDAARDDAGARDDAAADAAPPDASTDAGIPSCALTASGPIHVTTDDAVIEDLRITSTSGPAILVEADRVTLRRLYIEHADGPGIDANGADDLVVEDVWVEHTGAPTRGANPSDELNNIQLYQSPRSRFMRVKLVRGSSGIYLVESPDSIASFIEGHDFRGPFPRGQLLQWNTSDRSVLEDFSVVNPPVSWPEDNVNVYRSLDVIVRRGFISGNNSPSGVGVIFDGGNSTGVVEDVDAVLMGNGCFSAYDGGEGSTFRRTRCRDNICTDQGRGLPSSNALMWAGRPELSALRIEGSTYANACNPGNIVWPDTSFEVVEVEEQDFTPRAPLALHFCWE